MSAINELKRLNTKLYKVASFDITDLNLVESIAKTKKPIILSTGMCSFKDIQNAVKVCKKNKKNIILLQCTSLYPAPKNLANLRTIETMRKKFKLLTGYSDHTLDSDAALISVCLGFKVLERHFTLSKKSKDQITRLLVNPNEFKEMVIKIRMYENMIGDGKKIGPHKKEMEMFKERKKKYSCQQRY